MVQFIFRKPKIDSYTVAASHFHYYYVMPESVLLATRVFNLYLFQWRPWENNSEPLFNNISSESSTVSNFSYRHKLHLLELGQYIHTCFLYIRISVNEVFYLLTSSIQSITLYHCFFCIKRFFIICVAFLKGSLAVPLHNFVFYF